MLPVPYLAQLTSQSLLATQETCALAGVGLQAYWPTSASETFTSKNQAFSASFALVQSVGPKPEGAT